MQTKFWLPLAALAVLSGCSAATGGETAEANAATGSPLTVVDKLDVEGMHYSFVSTDQGLGMDIVGPATAGKPAVFRLMERYGELTTLEYYLALAPEGAAPDARLIAAHDLESQALGRADNAVLQVKLDPPDLVDKATVQNCRDWANTQRGGQLHTPIFNTFFDDATLTMAVGTGTTTTIATAVCNSNRATGDSGLAGTVDLRAMNETDFHQVGSSGDDGSPFILPSTANANPDNTYTHIQGPSSVIRRLRVNGFFLGAGHSFYMAISF
jgi:hypothetical protein